MGAAALGPWQEKEACEQGQQAARGSGREACCDKAQLEGVGACKKQKASSGSIYVESGMFERKQLKYHSSSCLGI